VLVRIVPVVPTAVLALTAAVQIVAQVVTRAVRIAALQISEPDATREVQHVVQIAALQSVAPHVALQIVVRLSVRYAARAPFAELTLFPSGPAHAFPFPQA
jgi:hypothetical protein